MENKDTQAFSQFNGLTKREYIATQLLTGILVSNYTGDGTDVNRAIELTDELLKQLSK